MLVFRVHGAIEKQDTRGEDPMKRLLFALPLIVLLLAACAPAATPAPNYAEQPSAGIISSDRSAIAIPGEAQAPGLGAVPAPTAGAGGSNAAVPPGQERLVIQNANLSMVVKDPRVTMEKIQAMAKGMGGYLVSSNLYDTLSAQGEKLPQATIVVRVPAEKLDDALKQIKSDALEPPTETRTGQDVTQDYVDLQSRLRNLQAEADQLTKIMNEATKTQDVLTVYNQLASVQEQIEVTKGQIQYYEQSAAFSEISTQLAAQESLTPIKVGGWTPQGALGRALQSLVNFFHGLVDFLIVFVVYWLPVLIVLAIPVAIVYFIVRAIRRRRSKKAPPADPMG
jgi:hypothetical protein